MSISLDKMTARDALTLWSWKFNNTNAPLSCSAKDYYDLWNINNKWDYLVQSVLFCRLEVSGQSSGRKTQKIEWHIKLQGKREQNKKAHTVFDFIEETSPTLLTSLPKSRSLEKSLFREENKLIKNNEKQN